MPAFTKQTLLHQDDDPSQQLRIEEADSATSLTEPQVLLINIDCYDFLY